MVYSPDNPDRLVTEMLNGKRAMFDVTISKGGNHIGHAVNVQKIIETTITKPDKLPKVLYKIVVMNGEGFKTLNYKNINPIFHLLY